MDCQNFLFKRLIRFNFAKRFFDSISASARLKNLFTLSPAAWSETLKESIRKSRIFL